jgi:hypothetical protein
MGTQLVNRVAWTSPLAGRKRFRLATTILMGALTRRCAPFLLRIGDV